MTVVTQRKPFEPISSVPRRHMEAIARTNQRKRNRGTTFCISQEAFEVLYREGEKNGGTIGGMTGLVVDYLARTGKFPALLREALCEGET